MECCSCCKKFEECCPVCYKQDLNYGDDSLNYYTINDEFFRLNMNRPNERKGKVKGVYNYALTNISGFVAEFGMHKDWLRKIDLNTALFEVKGKCGKFYRCKKYNSYKLTILNYPYDGGACEIDISDLLLSKWTLMEIPFSFNQQIIQQQCFPCWYSTPIPKKEYNSVEYFYINQIASRLLKNEKLPRTAPIGVIREMLIKDNGLDIFGGCKISWEYGVRLDLGKVSFKTEKDNNYHKAKFDNRLFSLYIPSYDKHIGLTDLETYFEPEYYDYYIFKKEFAHLDVANTPLVPFSNVYEMEDELTTHEISKFRKYSEYVEKLNLDKAFFGVKDSLLNSTFRRRYKIEKRTVNEAYIPTLGKCFPLNELIYFGESNCKDNYIFGLDMELYKNNIKSFKVGAIEHEFYIFDDKAVFFVRNKTTGVFKTVSNKINQLSETDNYPISEYWEDYDSVDFDTTKFVFKDNRQLYKGFYTNGKLFTAVPRSEDTVYINEIPYFNNGPFWTTIEEIIPIVDFKL
ncbi:hypothetical protein EZS27_010885 [termite gut metagenome]|uniref:Uncharacterized protein n=1 Tax=termite gut metagenome TaxID=433724 RepID=A0A5J4S634_9ZZZZ